MIAVGLTGGVGSGKSTVARLFLELGATLIDADEVAREVVEPGEPAWQDIRDAFGEGVFAEDGRLDRAALARVVFRDDEARAKLNRIVHPRVAERSAALMQAAKERGEAWLVYDVPLLYENGLESMFDTVVVVTASDETRKRRLVDREGWPEADIEARMRAQLPLAEKAQRADHVIDNDGSLLETRRQVEEVVARILGVGP